VQNKGWSVQTNGALLEKAAKEFDVFLTGDRNLTFQQKTFSFAIAVVVLHAESIQLRHTLPLMPKVLAALSALKSGEVTKVST
jgi:hypothetical protein